MTLYEINSQIDQILSNIEIDDETGEVLVDTLLEGLCKLPSHDVKIENIACFIGGQELKAGMQRLRQRRSKESQPGLKQKEKTYLNALHICLTTTTYRAKFAQARCKISYRKSTSTDVDEVAFLEKYKDDPKMCTPKPTEYKYDKNELKKMIKVGQVIEGVKVVENNNISIK